MGLLNMQLRDQSQVPSPDANRIILFADASSGQPRAKNSSGVIYDFVGPPGVRGSQWTYGTTLPTAPGISGDMYLKTDSGAVYQSTGGTNWVLIGNITGPQGPAVPLSSSSPSDVSTSAASGVSTSGARADHVHAHGNLAGGTLHSAVTTSVNGFMISTDKTKLDALGGLASTTPAAVGTAAVGVSTNMARADHVHAHGNQSGGTLHSAVTTSVNGFMTATDKTKLDALGSPATTATNVGTSSTAGTSLNLAREDHVHSHGLHTDGTLHAAVTTSVNGFMTATDKTKLNAYGSLATSAVTIGAANVAGTSSNLAREDHTHAHGVHTDGTMHAAVTGSANGFMIATDKTKLDAMGAYTGFATTATTVGAANAAGTSTNLAREDHVHAHGDQLGGTLHAAAVANGANGFLSGTDKYKLDTLPLITIIPAPTKTTTTVMTTAGTQYYLTNVQVPANALQVGSIIRFTAFASVTATANSLTVRFHYGTTGTTADPVITTTAMTTGTNTTSGSAELVSTVIVRSIGTTGTVFVVSRGAATGTSAFGASGNSVTTNTGTLNTTVPMYLGVSWSSSAGNVWTVQAAHAEVREQ